MKNAEFEALRFYGAFGFLKNCLVYPLYTSKYLFLWIYSSAIESTSYGLDYSPETLQTKCCLISSWMRGFLPMT